MIIHELTEPQISTKYYTTLSQDSPKSCLFKIIFFDKFE